MVDLRRWLRPRLASLALALVAYVPGSSFAAVAGAGADGSASRTGSGSVIAAGVDASGGATAASAASTSSTVKYEAPVAIPTAADPALEARMLAITSELRCLVCQNQTIADSHADLAVDLRQEVRELLQRGKSDAEVRRYMTDRYGDFVL